MFSGQIRFVDTSALGLKEERPVFQSSGSVGELIVLIIIFILVVVACYYITRFVGSKQLKQMKNSNFTVIDTYRVTANKFLQLVRMGEKYIVISVTKDSITVITELSKEEVILPESKSGQDKSFTSILSEMIKKKKIDGKG